MGVYVVVFVAGLGAGFACGRVKNRAKLAAIAGELNQLETSAIAEVKTVVARIRAKL